jgi:MFS family permease
MTAATGVLAFLPKGPALLAVLILIGMGALGVFPCYYAWSQELSTRHQGKVTGVTGVAAWIFSAPTHKFFGRLIDETKQFDFGLAIAGSLPLIAFIALALLWNSGLKMEGDVDGKKIA